MEQQASLDATPSKCVPLPQN